LRRPDSAADWAVRFDEAAREVMTQRPAEVGGRVQGDPTGGAPTTTAHIESRGPRRHRVGRV